jgi:hypothetical protein
MCDASQRRSEFFAARDRRHHTYYNFRPARNVFRDGRNIDNEARVVQFITVDIRRLAIYLACTLI